MYPTSDVRQFALLEFLEDAEVHTLVEYRALLIDKFKISDEESTKMQKPKKKESKPVRSTFSGDTTRDINNAKKYGHLEHTETQANFKITERGLTHLYFLRSKEKNNYG